MHFTMAAGRDKQNEHETESNLIILSSDDSKRFLSFSQNEIKTQISQCLKLFAENKINDKNAFQLQMIDFLFCALGKQDPTVMNLQMATACLDASSKLYGFRVDKVYSDLMKIVGIRRTENLNNEEADDLNLSKCQLRKRRRKSRYHILATIQELDGSLNIYNSKSFVNCNRDTQTSNLLIQASLPQHTTHGFALNLFNDILLDKIPLNGYKSSKTIVQVIDDFTSNELCPSTFKFLECFSDTITENSTKYSSDGQFLSSNNSDTNSDIEYIRSPVSDHYESELFSRFINNDQGTLENFEDAVENHLDPNIATFEYSYMLPNNHINWTKQTHWKAVISNNLDVEKNKGIESQKQAVKGKEKNFKISYTKSKKKQTKAKFLFSQGNNSSKVLQISKKMWSEDKLIQSDYFVYDRKRLFNFFNKVNCEKFKSDKNLENYCLSSVRESDTFNNVLNMSPLNVQHFVEDNFGSSCKEERSLSESRPSIPCKMLENEEVFINNNLVPAPKLVEKMLIPYSKMAKRINMSQFTEALWKNLYLTDEKNNNNIKTKKLSSLYLEIPTNLSKDAVKSLSPGLAFISLLHLANEKCLIIENQSDFSDAVVKSCKRNR